MSESFERYAVQLPHGQWIWHDGVSCHISPAVSPPTLWDSKLVSSHVASRFQGARVVAVKCTPGEPIAEEEQRSLAEEASERVRSMEMRFMGLYNRG